VKIYPSLKDLNLSSSASSDSELSKDDEADLEEEAAQYERDRYDLDWPYRANPMKKGVSVNKRPKRKKRKKKKKLEKKRLFVAPDKVQKGNLGEFLGALMTPHFITPQKIELRKDHLKTLNDFQKLLGDINWIRPYMRLSNSELLPLFEILKGDQVLSPHVLTPEAQVALEKNRKVHRKGQAA
jgi:hypothetical protein